jgi:hypothetical protein
MLYIMKQLRLAVLATVLLSIGLLFPSSSDIKATASGDATLIANQMMQIFQDWNMNGAEMANGANTYSALKGIFDNLNEKENDLNQMLSIIDNTQKSYESVRSIHSTSVDIVITSKELIEYVDFIEKNGTNFQIRSSLYILSEFNYRTRSLLENCGETMTTFRMMKTTTGSDYYNTISMVLKDYTSSINTICNDSAKEMAEMIKDIEQSKDDFANKNAMNKSFV